MPKRQYWATLKAATKLTKKLGKPPTYRELAEARGGLVISTVHRHIAKLEEHGWVSTGRGGMRSIKIIERDQSWNWRE